MAIIQTDGNPAQEVTLEHVPTQEDIDKATALALVMQDAASATAWIEGQQWSERWNEVDILYDAPRTFATWEGTNTLQPSVTRYILARHVNSIHPQMMEGLFYGQECFSASPKPGTEADTVRARSTVCKTQLDEMEFENEVNLGLFETVLQGTGIYKWGLRMVEEEEISYVRKQPPIEKTDALGQTIRVDTEESDEFEVKKDKRKFLRPFFENCEIRSILVDPKLKVPDIRKANFVIHKFYLTLDEILDLKADPNYDLPSEETIKSWFETPKEDPAQLGTLDTNSGAPSLAGQGQPDYVQTSEDPWEQGLMVLERWDKNKVITVLNEKEVIQNRENIYKVVPFYSSNWYNRIRAFWGLGVGRLIGQDQRLNQGLTNSGLALLQLILDPPFAISEDQNTPTQNMRFRKGGFIKVKGDVRTAIAPLEMPKLPIGEIFAFLQNSETESEAADGANSLVMQGSVPSQGGKSSITRTGTGVNAFTAASSSRLEGPMGNFTRQVFIPWLYQLDELNKKFLPMQQARTILGDELGPSFKFDEGAFLNGKVKFDVLAGSRLAAKRIVAQSLPILTQIFTNPEILSQLHEITGEYIDVHELLMMWLESSGWRNARSLIKKMTAEMQQRQQALNPAVQKAQADAAKMQQQGKQKADLQGQKAQEGIARDVIKASLEQGDEHILRQAAENAPDTLGQTQ